MRQDTDDDPADANHSETRHSPPRSRKRRRVLACDTCRRIKSRCDYNTGIGSCNRCKTLRISCSLSRSDGRDDQLNGSTAKTPETERPLLRELHARLAEQTVMLKELKALAEENRIRTLRLEAPVNRKTSVAPSPMQEDEEETESPADQDTGTAPVVIIRNVLRQSDAGVSRLSNEGLDGLVRLGLFPAHVAINLLNLFFKRSGSWLQATSWESLGVEPDLNSMSSVLIATCALQGLRFSHLCHTDVHRALYEHVRTILASVMLISPLKLESLYALAMASLWNMTPNRKAEYIDTWLLSGHCVQQAMLTINFTEVLANVREGQSNASDRVRLRLWNIICLSHLSFAVGTGRPSIIAEPYLDHCSSILNVFEASIEDGIVVAEINLYSTLLKLLGTSLPLQPDGKCKELEGWHEKWAHLLDVKVDRALAFRMIYHFTYLVLAQRSLRNIATACKPDDTTHDIHVDCSQYTSFSIDYATKLLQTLIRLPPKYGEVMPDYLMLTVMYSVLVLVACIDSAKDKVFTLSVIDTAVKYCNEAGVAPIGAAEFAISTLDRSTNQIGLSDVQAQPQEGIITEVYQEFSSYSGTHFGALDFPSLEDLFGGSFGVDEVNMGGLDQTPSSRF